jgi:outer membrane immunogenic protein
MRTSRLCVVAALAAAVFLGTKVQAADLGPNHLPPLTVPVENWTGFSFAVGGGIGIFNANVNTFAGRHDTIELCAQPIVNSGIACGVAWTLNETFSNFQDLSIDDLGDEGGFGTIQVAYDLQLGSQWVIGAWADADFYGGMDAEATQTSGSANNFFDIPISGVGPAVDFGAASTLTAKTEIGLDWGFSVGGRIGWLATPNTLLYFLAGYTYAELDKARLTVSTNAVFSTTQAGITSLGGGCPVFGGCPLGLTVNLPDSLDGYTLGGGSEVKIGGGPWSIKAEYRYTHLEGERGRLAEASAQGFATFDPGEPGPPLVGIRRNALANAEARIDDIDLHTVRAMLAYRF